MRSIVRLLPLVSLAVIIFVTVASAQLTPWSINVQTTPTSTNCKNKAYTVPAATSCPAAVAAAQTVFASLRDCAGRCPAGSVLIPGTPSCKIKKVSGPKGVPIVSFDVSIPFSCGEVIEEERSKCDEPIEMKDGQPVFPQGATDIEPPVDVDEDRGFLSQIYSGIDTSTDSFYPLPCEPSIGGILPPEAEVPPSNEDLEAEDFINKFEQNAVPKVIEELKIDDLMSKLPKFNDFSVGPCFISVKNPKNGQTTRKELRCDDPQFLQSGQPFEGRDIIYVHGLATEHLTKRIIGDTHVAKMWPIDSGEFLNSNGYFRKYAENYWRDHIRENLFDPTNPANPKAGWQWTASDPVPRYNPKSNRYLLVSWSSNQTLEFAQHAMLEQIRLAITTNKNVVTPPSYPSTHMRPFCSNGCIVITHSTGGLITSSAMALANAGAFGPGGLRIPKYIRSHVAFESAISGSRLASVGMAIALTSTSPAPNSLCVVYNHLLDMSDSCIQDTKFVAHSILRDLVPAVAQGVWGKILALSPVPTVTVAGGHPTGDYYYITKLFLPGLDDGVVSMNSACGNPNPVFPYALAPSGATVTSLVKAFDMSNDSAMLARAVKNFISHKNLMNGSIPGTRYLAGACTPYISPTGMVMPVDSPMNGTPWSTRTRYPNHYSFLQGSIDHAYDGASYWSNKWPSESGGSASVLRQYLNQFGPNREESSAITDKGIFKQFPDGTYLVHPSYANMREIVRGKRISFRFLKKRWTKWIWKRTYHLLDKWEQKQSSHYVYEFVGRR